MFGSSVKDYAISGLAAVLVLSLTWGQRVNHLRAQYKVALEETKANYSQAQAAAQAKHDAEVAAVQAQNRRLKDEADQQAAASTVIYRDRVIRLPAAAAQGSPGVDQLPNTKPAESADGPGGNPKLLERVTILRDDAFICADNTARLQAAHDWALGIADGTH